MSTLVTTTLQAAGLSAISNLLAQGIKAYRDNTAFSIIALVQFIFWTLVSCPPNILWQQYIEDKFPGYTVGQDGTKTLNIPNTATKFGLDQTIGALANTAAFLAAFAYFKGSPSVLREVRRETFPLMIKGWKLWPIVSILNFTVVPVHKRILVGSLVGLFWGIYLSLIAASGKATK